MKHSFTPKLGDNDTCAACHYERVAHTNQATCEACGSITVCEFFPDLKNPKKMLLCEPCTQKEYAVAVRQTQERVKAHEQVKSNQDYFNANIPAIVSIREAIERDPSIENKKVAEIVAVRDRMVWLKDKLFALSKETSAISHEQRESQIYLNHLVKDLSEEKQRELGLLDIKYKQPEGKIKSPKVTAPKKVNVIEVRKYAASFNIPEFVLLNIVRIRKVSPEEAAKIYIQMNNKVTGS